MRIRYWHTVSGPFRCCEISPLITYQCHSVCRQIILLTTYFCDSECYEIIPLITYQCYSVCWHIFQLMTYLCNSVCCKIIPLMTYCMCAIPYIVRLFHEWPYPCPSVCCEINIIPLMTQYIQFHINLPFSGLNSVC